MIEILAITLPIYLIIATGFVVVQAGYVGAEEIRAVGRLVMRVCIPATIFVSISRAPVAEVFRWDFLIGYLVASQLVFWAGFLLARRALGHARPAAVLEAMGMSCSNSAFMGFPIAAMVLGDVALQAFAMAMLVENIVMMPLATILADARGGRGVLRATLLPLARNPLLISVVAAVAVSASGIALPRAVTGTLEMLAPVSPPVALLAVGGTVAALSFAPIRGPILAIVAGKLLVHPLAVLAVLTAIGTVPEPLLLCGVLIASVPMLSIYALFGQRWGGESLAASALILATAASFFTVSALLWLIGAGLP